VDDSKPKGGGVTDHSAENVTIFFFYDGPKNPAKMEPWGGSERAARGKGKDEVGTFNP